MPRYMEQFERAERYYERFRKIDEGVTVSVPEKERYMPDSQHYDDDVLQSFFIHCYHVKDWIKNDPDVSESAKAEIEDFINCSKELAICADLCNGAKHSYLKRKPRSGALPEYGGSRATVHLRDSLDLKDRINVSLSGEDSITDANSLEEKPPSSGDSKPCSSFSVKYRIKWKEEELDAFELATSAMDAWRLFIGKMQQH